MSVTVRPERTAYIPAGGSAHVVVPSPASSGTSLANLGVPDAVRQVVEATGIRTLYPPQVEALGPVLRGESVLLACPTASGKSLVAYLALVRAALAHQTGLYLVPLRALAQEKFEELVQFESLGLKVGVSMGDFDVSAHTLERLDILVATSEKADGLLRKGSAWLDRLGCVVADEVHLMRDPERGPTLEVCLTRLRLLRPNLQVVALSATVGNSEELAAWLKARHVASEFRPIPLKSGVYFDGRITFTDLSTRPIGPPGEPLPRLVRTVLEDGGQALVFVNTRRSSEQTAQALAPTVRATLTPEGRTAAREAAEALGALGEEETEGIRRLSALLPNGIGFHNASLTNSERRVVERAFRDRVVRVLVATPTLAAGINLPARRVIVRDTTRYDDRLGMQAPIPALEVQQMCGRAGRPGLDPAGEAVLLARSEEEVESHLDDYLSAPPEAVRSQLAAEPALRMHLLALVASGAVRSSSDLQRFFESTFFGHARPVRELDSTVQSVRAFLEAEGFLDRGERLRATEFGTMTSELYLDPMSAIVLRSALERAPIGVRPFALLSAIAATPDLPPMFLRRNEEKALLERFLEEEAELLVKPEEEPLRLDLDLFLSTLKTACVLEAWISETPIVQITDRFNIGAGDVRGRVEDAEWLLGAATRLSLKFQRRATRSIDALSLRVRYGVRDELLDLVRLSGIGRVRGRALFDAGFADRDSLRSASVARLEAVLNSRSLAQSVLHQVGAPTDPIPGSGLPTAVPNATTAVRARRKSRPLEEFRTGP
ncbi:MAG: DEAD/DEAH box helicase [Thermoplasmata archaeon]|nr:DEAD/DEAH box helicase [Thermoplasmata archaeon]